MKALLLIALLAVAATAAVAQDFPDSIGMCGEGACKDTPVIKDEGGYAIGVGPVDATIPLGTPGAYPKYISLCGRGVCVTVPVKTFAPLPHPVPYGDGDFPDSIGLCGRGVCKVTPVNKDATGFPVSVGPVDSSTLGVPGDYPIDVGICGRGICVVVPVVGTKGGRKLL